MVAPKVWKVRGLDALGTAIRLARGGRRLEDIAATAAPLSVSALSRLERGERVEGFELLFRVLDAVGLDMELRERRGSQAPKAQVIILPGLPRDLRDDEMKHVLNLARSLTKRGRAIGR